MESKVAEGLQLRKPVLDDGKAVHDLIGNCPPLDLNSTYNYFLLCSHFSETCVVGEQDSSILAFLSAYRLPKSPETLFVWQVAVDGALRGHGMAGRMLEEVLVRPACRGVRYVETTVSPSNIPSRRFFERYAEKRQLGWHEETFLTEEQFGGESHESEVLFRIGPLLKP
ncbi:diaminobutyrate acetyltransferase [Thiohalomonas denitrificans]|uniref:diaminobutyrate acetyltransferase n=1 Tax=Thiohalomonas denitrificans TaxID=415747 RepID=UPI0026EDE6A7|nr:diaminobutyrate acetyltransferase [Thiohalomonas denitrificans]